MRAPIVFAAAAAATLTLVATSCATAAAKKDASSSPAAATKVPRPAPFPAAEPVVEPPDIPRAASTTTTLIQNATVMTAAGKTYEKGHVLLVNGKIAEVGDGSGKAPSGAAVVDASGMFVTPGLIDTHSHMGVYPLPNTVGNDDGNEAVRPTTPGVWAEHGFWPQDPALTRAVRGGITSIQVLPGSANLIGGRSFTAKLHIGKSAREMRFPGAPQGLKMACGENPKRVYGEKGGPQTRMGNVLGYRRAFQEASEYRRRWAKYDRDLALWREKLERTKKKDAKPLAEGEKPDEEPAPIDPPEPPGRDLELETLAGVLDGKILVHNHCYRADEMNIMMDIAKQYRFKIRSFHHAVEAYKIRDRLAAEGVAVSTWDDWWGFKMESYDGVPENVAMLTEAGARAIIKSDSESEIRHLNQEAGKALAAGKRMGIKLDENDALRWITANPAWALGVDEMTGTLTEGKMADVVIWDHDPFSVYAKTVKVFIDGDLVFDRASGKTQLTDFEVMTGVSP